MENTPVANEVVVPKKNVLFEVTPVSKVLAGVLFIILPFMGFWLGTQYSSKQLNAVEMTTVQSNNKTKSEVQITSQQNQNIPTSNNENNLVSVNRNNLQGLSFVVPDGWSLDYNKIPGAVGENETYILRSADYKSPTPGCRSENENCNLPSKGMEITVSAGGFYNLHSSSIESMQLAIADDSWPNPSKRIVSVGGGPSLVAEGEAINGDENGEVLFARGTVKEGIQYDINLISSEEHIKNVQIFETFLSKVEID